MKPPKVYLVSDLFCDSWKDLDDFTHAIVYALRQHAQAIGSSHKDYGFALIAVLRPLRKNKRLVDRITVEQAVDIYNDLKFLNEPWYYFPFLDQLHLKPDPQLARTSFDQFIYADNEFTSFIATKGTDDIYLRRLAATLYKEAGEIFWDKECVEERAEKLRSEKSYLLELIFYTYGHVRNKVMERCKTLLPKSIVTYEEQKKPQPTGSMWHNIKHQAAKTLVFGDFDNVGRTNMYSVLDHLEILCKEKEEQRGKR